MISHRHQATNSTTAGDELNQTLLSASGESPHNNIPLDDKDMKRRIRSRSQSLPSYPTDVEEDTEKKLHSTSFCTRQVLFSCSLFMVAGPLLIMTNKSIITELDFKYPVMVTSFGIIASSIIVHLFHRLGYIQIRAEIKQLVTIKFLVTHIFIIAFLQSLTMYFGNKAYLYLSVSLIQMLKAFTPVITMCLLFITQQSQPTYPLIGAILLLSFGTSITSTGVSPNDANVTGFLLAAGAQFTEALKLTLQQKLLQGFKAKMIGDRSAVESDKTATIIKSLANDQVEYEKIIKMSTFEGLYYYAPMTFISICIIIVPLELEDFMQYYDENMQIMKTYYWVFICAGLLGFFVNVAAFMVTKVTSGLYLKALNAFRNVCLVVACVIVFGDVVTLQQIVGYGITLIGFAYYNYIKLQGK